MSIKLDLNDGLETIELDEERKFKIDTNDISIISKSMKFAKDVDEKLKNYGEKIQELTSKDGEPLDIDNIDFDKMCELNDDVCEFIYNGVDYVFGKGVSNAIFKNVSPLTITNDGEYYVVALFSKLMPVIAEKMEKATDKAFANASKYTNKYIKE